MAQFDVYRNTNPATKSSIPYLLDVQTDLLDMLKTRVVVPLEECSQLAVAQRLTPSFQIESVKVMMSTPELAGIHTRSLGEYVCSVAEHRQDIMAALDMLFSGI
ncbi:MAG: CcdB family protein [Candidatus Thiothrix singaporensis]|uniref:Toxin CcdB n=1 Tax=Candidatus Thiothrix singaporensis TaxID=2799669 RepID=A0A7L6ARA6_9GAMM|nr:MAG: CcdB family protein [Candidatus Thiothrix singaporensis]